MSRNLDNTTRTCMDCGQTFPLTEEFFRRQKAKNGKYYFQQRCRKCRAAKDVRYYAENREHIRAYKSEWEKANPDKVREQKQHSRKRRDPEKVRAEKQRSHIRCREKNNERSRQWYHANREHTRQLAAEYYQEHRETKLQQALEYQANNPEYVRAREARRRARKAENGGMVTQEELRELFEQQESRCAYCGTLIFFEIERDVQLEHMTPIAKGGSSDITNLCYACPDCNLSKHDKTVDEWRAVRGW